MRASTVGLLVLCTLGLCAMPLVVEAQPSRNVPRLGVLVATGAAENRHLLEAFREGLRERGWVEGQNIAIEYRYAEAHYERLPDLATALVRLPVDLIVAFSAPSAKAATQATTTIPIIMETVADPVAFGLVENLARPGGNLTGISGFSPALHGKRLEILREAVPGLTRVAVLTNPANPNASSIRQETERAASALGVQLHLVEVREPDALEGALATVMRAHAEGLIVVPDPLLWRQHGRIMDFAARHRLPVVSERKEFAEAGALMTYGVNFAAQWRRVAYYVDRLLHGAQVADLPIERNDKFALVLNLKTAKALGITIPPHLLVLADEVLQ